MMTILDERIDKAKSICILGHQIPDGDCMGSGLAVYNYILSKYGNDKKVKVYFTEFSDKYMILPNADKISHDTNDAEVYDLSIIVDCGAEDRFKDFARYFKESKDSIVFDHHENNILPTKVSVVDPSSIATCELLFNHLDKDYINKDVAMCLYAGIATDSGVFRYRNTSRKTFEIAGLLLDYGFNQTELLDTIMFDNTVNQRKIQAVAFERIKLVGKGKVVYSYLLDEDLENFNLTKSDIDNVIVYLREITGIKIAAFFYPTGHNIYKVSLRSKDDKYDVSDFASKHDGGGHKLASGCLYYGDINSCTSHFEKDIVEFYNEK